MAERGAGGRFMPKLTGADEEPPPADNNAPPPVAKDPGTESITDGLVGSMAGPNHAAIAAVTAREGRAEPEIADEPPKRGRGRPKGATTKRSRISALAGDAKAAALAPGTPEPMDPDVQRRISAATAAQMTFMTGIIIGGPDFAPRKNELAGGVHDAEFLTEAYFVYFKSKNMPDLPPGLALACALMAYVAPRLTQPETQSRVKTFFSRVAGVFKRIFKRKNNAAQPDRRDDGERKDDAKQEARS